MQTDNKILVTGKTWNGSDWDMALVRYNTNGILDMTFGTGGKVVTAIGTGIDDSRSVTVQADGKIVVVGRTSNGSNEDVALLRYNTDGSLDNSFGSGGKVTTAIGSRVCRILCKRTIPRRLTSARP